MIKIGAMGASLAVVFFLAWWGASVGLKVFDDYKDSTDATYLFAGGVILAISGAILLFTFIAGLPQHMTPGNILAAVVLGLLLAGGALLYVYYGPPSDPPGPDYHRTSDAQGGPAGPDLQTQRTAT